MQMAALLVLLHLIHHRDDPKSLASTGAPTALLMNDHTIVDKDLVLLYVYDDIKFEVVVYSPDRYMLLVCYATNQAYLIVIDWAAAKTVQHHSLAPEVEGTTGSLRCHSQRITESVISKGQTL